MLSIKEFCELHDACDAGREWALAKCKTMADVWATAPPGWLVWVATRQGVVDDQTLRLFAVFCDRSEATPEELTAARSAADAASAAARAAAWAAWAAAWAAWDAARAALAARDAASAAAWDLQATWLRENCLPNFLTGGE